MAIATDLEDRQVDAGGLRTRYWDVGEGPPVVLLHGIGAHTGFWRAAIPGLAEHYRLLIPDMCGFGRSQRPSEVSRTAFGDWLAGFIQALDIGPCAAVGNSMGGGVVLATALDHPECVDRIVLSDSISLGRNVMFTMRLLTIPLVGELLLRNNVAAVRRMLAMLAVGPDWIWDGLLEETVEMGEEPGAQAFFLEALRWGVSLFSGFKERAVVLDELGDLAIPVQVIWGRQDPLFPLGDAEAAMPLFRDARLDVIDDCGHMPHMERPAEFNRLVVEFLTGGDAVS
ncbi:MAG: alpha/beta fold hydrolase [Chloroflexota bacterium]|nr:alpha/beta fold hydrolase [Chloroflexota bacterium]MDP6508484.1 alpha/beta fold hydrolase [Chloroflexota bacterium]MDP6757573.1 alpha/beta fold hydrolase [Chloroflexota bacterium]